MSGVEGLRVEKRGAALWLVLDRPHRRNALTLEMADALAEELEAAAEPVRSVVITGAGPAFCAGGDAHDLLAVASQGPQAVSDVVYLRFQRLVSAIASAPVPVIAAVNGPAAGGGLDLALWCDLRVASSTATFLSTWVRLGLVPGMGGAAALTELVGSARAAEVVLLGEPLAAATALAWGLVNDVVEPDHLEERVTAMTDRLADLPAVALRRSKEALRRGRDHGLASELATLSAIQATLATSETFRAITGPQPRS
jgi:2-(1,2-epoxy-1,2-dihydrophenyl)acetyl-CoA isomerase